MLRGQNCHKEHSYGLEDQRFFGADGVSGKAPGARNCAATEKAPNPSKHRDARPEAQALAKLTEPRPELENFESEDDERFIPLGPLMNLA